MLLTTTCFDPQVAIIRLPPGSWYSQST